MLSKIVKLAIILSENNLLVILNEIKRTQKYSSRASHGGAIGTFKVCDFLPAVVVGEDEVEAPHVDGDVGVQHRVQPNPRQRLSFHFSEKHKSVLKKWR